jgi:hypothetical protein
MPRRFVPFAVSLLLSIWLSAPEARAQDAREGFVGVGRAGFVLGGGGEAETECDGDCGTIAAGDDDFDDESGFMLGMDFMGHLNQNLRLGGGFMFFPSNEVDFDDGGDYESGSDLSALFIVEGVFDVSPVVALAARGQIGAIFLFPGEDLEDDIDDFDTFCNNSALECDVNEGPYVGFTLGGGGAAIFDVGAVALRLDLMLQWYTINIAQTEVDAPGVSAELHRNITGTRFILAGGVEF